MLKPKTSNESDKVVSKLASAVHDILTIFIVFPSLQSVVCSSSRLYGYRTWFEITENKIKLWKSKLCFSQNTFAFLEVSPQNAFELSLNKPRDITVELSSTRCWYIMLLHVKKTLK